jgi:hypothetical protein
VATPVHGTVTMIGQVAEEPPGTLVAPGAIVTSIMDSHSHQYEYYAIDLVLGQSLRIDTELLEGCCGPLVSVRYPSSGDWEQTTGVIASVSGRFEVKLATTESTHRVFRYRITFSVTD